MLINVTASFCFFIVLMILMIDFNSKEKLDTLDNNSFKHLSITSTIGLIIEFFDYLLVLLGFEIQSIYMIALGKLIFLYYIIFMYYFIRYVYITCHNIKEKTENYKKYVKVLTIIYATLSMVAVILPYSFAETTDYLYPIGLATNFSYLVGALGVIYIIIMCVTHFKNLKKKK